MKLNNKIKIDPNSNKYPILKNWVITINDGITNLSYSIKINGIIYNDKVRNRFKDGQVIYTSNIQQIDLDKGFAITSNTIYKLDMDSWNRDISDDRPNDFKIIEFLSC